jgi:PAS domain S-box-containing protein
MKDTTRVLIIEDNENDTILEVNELIKGGFNIEFERVETRDALRDALRNKSWDCILSDYSLPQFSGLDALAELKETGIDIPFILISGAMGEETAVAAMKAGAHDYIMKNNMKRLIPALERELREAEVRRQKWNAEEAIHYERMLLRILVDNLPDQIYVKDPDCRRIIANTADLAFIGCSSESEVIGKTDPEILMNDESHKNYNDDITVLKTGKPIINREDEIVDAKGRNRWVLTTKIPIYNNQGLISGLVGLGHDITERKRAEIALKKSEQDLLKQNLQYHTLNNEYIMLNQELNENVNSIRIINSELIESKNRAEESDKLKSAFLANMSHEIRTPLNAILGFSELLNDTGLSREKTSEYHDIIEFSSQQLLTIINDILDISKIEAGQLSISLDIVDVNNLLQETFLQYKQKAESKNINLVLSTDSSGKNLETRTDEIRVRQVICNLLDNALKFTTEGKIEFGCNVEGNFVKFFVKDTGIGIIPENQSIIFKPFRQVETTSIRNYRGNGLGLSISKALVEKLGGTLTLNSEPGRGSTFTFTIPYVRAAETGTGLKSKTVSHEKHNWKKYLVLVVEDELYNFSYIEEVLASTNIQIIHAWNGQQAVDMVKDNPDISLVLMDIRMPVMDGYAATRKIKELRPKLPVIAQTAYAFSEDKENALQLGFDDYLTKPSSRDFVVEVISSYLDGDEDRKS